MGIGPLNADVTGLVGAVGDVGEQVDGTELDSLSGLDPILESLSS